MGQQSAGSLRLSLLGVGSRLLLRLLVGCLTILVALLLAVVVRYHLAIIRWLIVCTILPVLPILVLSILAVVLTVGSHRIVVRQLLIVVVVLSPVWPQSSISDLVGQLGEDVQPVADSCTRQVFPKLWTTLGCGNQAGEDRH